METLCSWLLVHVEKWMYDMGYCVGGWIYDVHRRHDGKLMYDMCHHVGKWMYDLIRHDGKLMYDMCHHVGKCIFDMCCHFGKSMFDTSAMSDNNYVTNVMSAMNFRRICHVSSMNFRQIRHISNEFLTDVLHIRLIENAGNSEIGRRLYSNT